jgi:hypothetical protein
MISSSRKNAGTTLALPVTVLPEAEQSGKARV